jgi:hypothetical protein
MTPLDYEPQGKRMRRPDRMGAWDVVGWVVAIVGGSLMILAFLAGFKG